LDCGSGAILEFLEDDASGFGVFNSQFSGSIGNGFAIFDYSLDELFSSLHKMGDYMDGNFDLSAFFCLGVHVFVF
jgi:hypothetical protein